jgi:hypothetical protein
MSHYAVPWIVVVKCDRGDVSYMEDNALLAALVRERKDTAINHVAPSMKKFLSCWKTRLFDTYTKVQSFIRCGSLGS